MLSKEQILERNKLIGDNGRQTRMKRAKQICKTFKFKIDWDNLNLNQKETLKMMFVEAKWIYNYILSQDDIYSFDYKNINSITHKDKNKNDIPVNNCGQKYDDLKLKDREFVCPNCGNKKDRDTHAANNMIYFYLKYYNAPGTGVSMSVKKVKFSKQLLKQESTTTLV